MKKLTILFTFLLFVSCAKDYGCTDNQGNEIGKQTCDELLDGCLTDGFYCTCWQQNCN